MVISYDLLREIDAKKMVVDGNPDYYLKMNNHVSGDLRHISNIYSFWLENPDMRKGILVRTNSNDSRDLRKIAREGVRRIGRAWSYLNNFESKEGDFVQSINPDLIMQVANFVDPDLNSKGFRDLRVSLGFKDYCPPNHLKVPSLVERFCSELKDSDYHPVEAAAFSHITLAGIQPFYDGNKRTARLIQDKILHSAELPPAVIPYGERAIYIDLLEQGLVGMRDVEYEKATPFFNYIGCKVNCVLDDIIGDLHL